MLAGLAVLCCAATGKGDPCAIANPCAFTFETGVGKNPPPQALIIDVDGGLYFSTTVTLKNSANGVKWLSVQPPTGTLGGGRIGAPTILPAVVVNSRDLSSGTYTGEIQLKVHGGGDPAATLPVTLKVAER